MRARGLRLRDEFALRRPGPGALPLWLAAFVVLVVLGALVERALGLPPVEPWGGRYTGVERALRALGIVLVAPAAEELVFRGVFFTRLARTRLGDAGAAVVAALLFSALHVQYSPLLIGFILADGLFYGAARATTGSVLVPMACHVLGNTYAALERLA